MTPTAPRGPYKVEPWSGKATGFYVLDSDDKILCSVIPREQGDEHSIAHLIAGSPDLLEAAKEVIEILGSTLGSLQRLRKAVNKMERGS